MVYLAVDMMQDIHNVPNIQISVHDKLEASRSLVKVQFILASPVVQKAIFAVWDFSVKDLK